MNKPSLDKFESSIQKDGLIVLNNSLIDQEVKRDDVRVLKIQANDIANKLGNLRVANMVTLGAYVKKSGVVRLESIFKALEKALAGKNQKILDLNKVALKKGEDIAKE